jgi:hypothetical protein
MTKSYGAFPLNPSFYASFDDHFAISQAMVALRNQQFQHLLLGK